MGEFEPKIVAFLCWKWGYGAADMAGTIRAQYPAGFRPIRVLCTARVSEDLIMRAFAKGADGVMIGGWHIGECNFINGNEYAQKLVAYMHEVMESMGLERERLDMIFVSAAEGSRFRQLCIKFDEQVRKVGPNPLKKLQLAAVAAEKAKAKKRAARKSSKKSAKK